MSHARTVVGVLAAFISMAGCARKSASPDMASPDAPTKGRGAQPGRTFSVTLVGEDRLKASFVRKRKSQEGYEITVRFVNTTDMDVAKLSTECHLFEGDWKIRSWGVMRVAHPVLISANSHEDMEWIDGVSSSIDRIVIEVLGVE